MFINAPATSTPANAPATFTLTFTRRRRCCDSFSSISTFDFNISFDFTEL